MLVGRSEHLRGVVCQDLHRHRDIHTLRGCKTFFVVDHIAILQELRNVDWGSNQEDEAKDDSNDENGQKDEFGALTECLHYLMKTKRESTGKDKSMDFPIPIRCYTCNLPLAGKWKTYLEKVKAYRIQDGRPENGDLVYLKTTTRVTAEGRAMNDLGLTRECCRRHLLTHPGV